MRRPIAPTDDTGNTHPRSSPTPHAPGAEPNKPRQHVLPRLCRIGALLLAAILLVDTVRSLDIHRFIEVAAELGLHSESIAGELRSAILWIPRHWPRAILALGTALALLRRPAVSLSRGPLVLAVMLGAVVLVILPSQPASNEVPVGFAAVTSQNTWPRPWAPGTFCVNIRAAPGRGTPIVARACEGGVVRIIERRRDGWTEVVIVPEHPVQAVPPWTHGFISSELLRRL